MKAILLVRVSTKVQDFDEQEKEIYRMAVKDGYKPEDIISICEKESGIKLPEEERAGLNRMKELIESDNTINCVYCWEVSRIARKKKINFSVLDYLVERKVQLIVKNPSIRLLKDDGTVDEAADMVFTLFSQMAESEMRTKLARWKRTKDANRKQSIYTGGWLLYGYKVDNGKIVEDEKEASVVRKIFNMYLTGNYSYNSLAKELTEQGIIRKGSRTYACKFVSLTLRNIAYAGEPSSFSGLNKLKTEGNVYPPIVTIEMINKCKEIAKGNILLPKKKYDNYYFGKGLLRCPYCGSIMVAKKNNNTYHCQNCDKGIWVQINIVDSILWRVASGLYLSKLITGNTKDRITYQKKLKEYDNKIATSEKNLKDIENRITKVEDSAYLDGTMSIDRAKGIIKQLGGKLADERKMLSQYYMEREQIQGLLIKVDEPKELDVSNITDDKLRFEIIHETIEYAFIDRINTIKCNISIYIPYNNEPLRFELHTKANKVFSLIDGYSKGEEIKCYERRFITPRNVKKSSEYNKRYCQEHKEENARRQREYRARKKALKENGL